MSLVRPIRLGLIGVGKIARDQHLPAITADDHFDLVATADPAGGIAGVPNVAGVEELLGSGLELDAVVIATPPRARHRSAIAAIETGLAVMVEKPPCATIEEAEDLAARARQRGTTLFTAWHSQEATGVDVAAAWLRGKELRSIAVEWREDIRRWHPGQDWILDDGGFGVFDPGINALSILTKIVPGPFEVRSALLGFPSNRRGPLTASIEMALGVLPVRIELDFLKEGRQQWDLSVVTDQGSLMLRDGGRILKVDGLQVQGEDDEYPRLYRRFADLIARGESAVDLAPQRLVADCYAAAFRQALAPFHW